MIRLTWDTFVTSTYIYIYEQITSIPTFQVSISQIKCLFSFRIQSISPHLLQKESRYASYPPHLLIQKEAPMCRRKAWDGGGDGMWRRRVAEQDNFFYGLSRGVWRRWWLRVVEKVSTFAICLECDGSHEEENNGRSSGLQQWRNREKNEREELS